MLHTVGHTVVLTLHVAAGAAILILGPIAMFSAKRRGRHTRVGDVYHWVFFVLFVTAVGLALLNWDEVWWLALVGVGSYAFALLGFASAKRRWHEWVQWHVIGQGGSYIAAVTALLVVNWGDLTGSVGREAILPWLLPTLVGTPLIAWLTLEVAAGRRPRGIGLEAVREAEPPEGAL
jgi:hypothetical protein